MKIRTFLFGFLLTIGCSADKWDAVDRILSSDEFSIKVHTQSCFGDSDMTFKVVKNGDQRIFEFPTQFGEPIKTTRINLTNEKEVVLKEFLNEGIKGNHGGTMH